MKKGILYLSLLFYLVYCNGVNFHLHYCGEKIASISVYFPWGGCGCETEAEEPENCCKDEVISVKTGEEHAQTPFLSLLNPIAPTTVSLIETPDLAFISLPLLRFEARKPPPKPRLYLLHQVFII